MDEKKLAELFNEAVRDAPPATFGTGEVRKASQRATARHRQNVMVGSVLAVVLLGGGGITTVALTGGTSDTKASSPVAAGSADSGNSGTMRSEGEVYPPPVGEGPPSVLDQPEASKQGGSSAGGAGSSGTRTPSGGCDTADRELAAALASELPAAPEQPQIKVPFVCPSGSRGAAFKVTDGARSGTISVVLIPKGVEPGFAPMGIEVPGTQSFSSTTLRSGGLLYVVSQPTPELAEAPYSEIGPQLANSLAREF